MRHLTFLCDQLETRGYVHRAPSQSDKRLRVVKITDAGRVARAEVGESLVNTTPLGQLATPELQQLRDLLDTAPDCDSADTE